MSSPASVRMPTTVLGRPSTHTTGEAMTGPSWRVWAARDPRMTSSSDREVRGRGELTVNRDSGRVCDALPTSWSFEGFHGLLFGELIAQFLDAFVKGMFSRVFSQVEIGPRSPHAFRCHDLVGGSVAQHFVLVNPRLVGECVHSEVADRKSVV